MGFASFGSFWADCCGFYGVGLELLLDGLGLFLDRQVDKLVFGGDAGEDATEVGGAQDDGTTSVVAGGNFGAIGDGLVAVGVDEVEKAADDVAGNEGLMLGESDLRGIAWKESIAEDGALKAYVFPVGGGARSHFLKETLGTGTGQEWPAATEVVGEAEGVEIIDESVVLFETLIGVVDFGVGETEVEFAIGVVLFVDAVVGVGEDVVGGETIGVGKNVAAGGVVAEELAAGEVVDDESSEEVAGEGGDCEHDRGENAGSGESGDLVVGVLRRIGPYSECEVGGRQADRNGKDKRRGKK